MFLLSAVHAGMTTKRTASGTAKGGSVKGLAMNKLTLMKVPKPQGEYNTLQIIIAEN